MSGRTLSVHPSLRGHSISSARAVSPSVIVAAGQQANHALAQGRFHFASFTAPHFSHADATGDQVNAFWPVKIKPHPNAQTLIVHVTYQPANGEGWIQYKDDTSTRIYIGAGKSDLNDRNLDVREYTWRITLADTNELDFYLRASHYDLYKSLTVYDLPRTSLDSISDTALIIHPFAPGETITTSNLSTFVTGQQAALAERKRVVCQSFSHWVDSEAATYISTDSTDWVNIWDDANASIPIRWNRWQDDSPGFWFVPGPGYADRRWLNLRCRIYGKAGVNQLSFAKFVTETTESEAINLTDDANFQWYETSLLVDLPAQYTDRQPIKIDLLIKDTEGDTMYIDSIVIDEQDYSQPRPTFAADFDSGGLSALYGQRNLSTAGQSVKPAFLYNMKDAGASTLTPWNNIAGETLNLAGTGSSPLADQGCPLVGPGNTSCHFQGGKGYQGTDGTIADLASGFDLVIETVVRIPASGSDIVVSKRLVDASGTGWVMWISSATIQIAIVGSATKTFASSSLTPGAWYHIMAFINQSENSTNSARIFANGVSIASSNIYGAGNTSSAARSLEIGMQTVFTSTSNAKIAYVAGWIGSNILTDGAAGPTEWATIAQARFWRMAGVWPTIATGTATPQAVTRNLVSTTDKQASSGTVTYYSVGPHWPRIVSRNDSASTEVTGYLAERQTTQINLQSNNLSHASWTYNTGLASVTQNVTSTPHDYYSGWTLTEDSSASAHMAGQSVSITNGYAYAISAIVKAGARTKFALSISSSQYARFNLSNGTIIDTAGTAATTNRQAAIRALGSGWYYVTFSFLAAATTGVVASYHMLDASGSISYTGDGASDIKIMMTQFESNSDAALLAGSSYIHSTTATVQRPEDILRFKGDDGNLGGTGSSLAQTIQADILLPSFDNDSNLTVVSLNDGGSSADEIIVNAGSTDAANLLITATGGTPRTFTGSSDITDNTKATVKAQINRAAAALYVDGSSEASEAIATADIPDDKDRIDVGHSSATANTTLRGVISKLRIYNQQV